MASIQLPGWKPQERKEQKKDPLDMIQQGLQIAASAYGIYADSEKLDLARKTQSQGAEVTAAEIKERDARTKALADKNDDDYLSQKERAGLAEKGWMPSAEKAPGAQAFAVKGGTEWWSPPKPKAEAKPDDGLNQKDIADLMGKGWTPSKEPSAQTFKTKGGGAIALLPPKPEAPGAKMPETERAATDKAADGLMAVADMRDAINSVAGRSGIRQAAERVKFMSDTPYTEARTRYTEAIGRLASGGAINKDEEARFLGMAPGPLDSYAMAQIKLNNAYSALAARVKARGMDPDKIMAERRELARKAPQLNPQREFGTATAAPGAKPVREMTTEELMRELGQ